MRKSCCLGCLTVLLLIAGGGFGAGYFLSRMELLERAAPVDTVRYLGGRPAVLVHIDSDDRSLLGLVEYALASQATIVRDWLLESMPYESTWALEPGVGDQIEMTLATSMPRIAGLLEWRADPALWRWWDGQEVDRLSREAPGLWVVRSHLNRSEAAAREVEARWKPKDEEALRLGGGHVVELLIDNRDGRAFSALEPLIHPPPQPGDLPQDPTGGLDTTQLAAFFARIETAWTAVDLPANDRALVRMEIVCPDAHAAEALHFFALMGLDNLRRNAWDTQGIRIQGEFVRDGRVLAGNFTLGGIRETFVTQVRQVGL